VGAIINNLYINRKLKIKKRSKSIEIDKGI